MIEALVTSRKQYYSFVVLSTRNNTDGNKLVIFSSIALYHGDTKCHGPGKRPWPGTIQYVYYTIFSTCTLTQAVTMTQAYIYNYGGVMVC